MSGHVTRDLFVLECNIDFQLIHIGTPLDLIVFFDISCKDSERLSSLNTQSVL
jgi:hypothetical protein